MFTNIERHKFTALALTAVLLSSVTGQAFAMAGCLISGKSPQECDSKCKDEIYDPFWCSSNPNT